MLAQKLLGATAVPSASTGWRFTGATLEASLDVRGTLGWFNPLIYSLLITDAGGGADTRLIFLDRNTDSIKSYPLATAGDISTVIISGLLNYNLNTNGGEGLPLCFDIVGGTHMVACGASRDDIMGYTLSSSNDISTATFNAYHLTSGLTNPAAVTYSADGLKVYANTGSTLYTYSLSTPFTGTASQIAATTLPSSGALYSCRFNSDGTKMVYSDASTVYLLGFSTPYDVSTYSLIDTFDPADDAPRGVAFSSDVSRMYIAGSASSVILQYTLGA